MLEVDETDPTRSVGQERAPESAHISAEIPRRAKPEDALRRGTASAGKRLTQGARAGRGGAKYRKGPCARSPLEAATSRCWRECDMCASYWAARRWQCHEVRRRARRRPRAHRGVLPRPENEVGSVA